MVSGTSARKEGLRTLTSPRREASLFKLGRNLWFRPFSFLPFQATSGACQTQRNRGYPRPRGVARANPLAMTLQFDRSRCMVRQNHARGNADKVKEHKMK